MNITPRAEPVPVVLPLPMHMSSVLADAVAEDGSTFTITAGLDAAGVEEFRKHSCDTTDTDLMRFTSDHARICEGSYEAWYMKERHPFALRSADGALAGLIWFGPKEFPLLETGSRPQTTGAWHTFAIRTYAPYRGKHLAQPFAAFVLDEYMKLLPGHPIWLDTHGENTGAIKLYERLGFIRCGTDQKGRVVMAKKVKR